MRFSKLVHLSALLPPGMPAQRAALVPISVLAQLLALTLLLPASSAAAQPFERQVTPFPVLDSSGAAYDQPFGGGFNTPRPQLVDIDADADLDLFIQEEAGRVIHYENAGTAPDSGFVWRTSSFGDLSVGQWNRFVDADADGDYDVLAEEPNGFVRYYRNEGASSGEDASGPSAGPAFTLVEDTLRRTDGEAIFISPQNTPAAADLTCDGLPDLIEGQTNGRMAFYEHAGLANGAPQFRLVSDNYQNLCFGPPSVCGFQRTAPPRGVMPPQGPAPSGGADGLRHGASALGAGDVDADGDPDLLWGDFFQESMYFVENHGGCPRPDLSRSADLFPPSHPMVTGGYNAPYPADLDGDGDDDLVAGVLASTGRWTVDNLFYFEYDDGTYELRTRRLIRMLDVGRRSAPALVDINGDGRRDMLIGNSIAPSEGQRARVALLANTGDQQDPAFRVVDEDLLNLPQEAFNAVPEAADIDADGDADLLVGFFDGSLLYFENTGSPQEHSFEERALSTLGLADAMDAGTNAAPALHDVDSDGDVDLLVGRSRGTIALFRNGGSPEAPDFRLENESFASIEADDAYPEFADVDGKGAADLLLGTERGLRIYVEADGSYSEQHQIDIPSAAAAPAAADLDGDGRLDLIVGSERGGLFYYRQKGDTTRGGAGDVLVNTPNPFSNSTELWFTLEEPAHVRILIYDVWGRRVAVALDATRTGGRQFVEYRPAGHAAGVYPFTLIVDGRLTAAGKMVYAP